MGNKGKSFGPYFKHFFVYLAAGLVLDTILIIFFSLCDILGILNLSYERIFDAGTLMVKNITSLYLGVFYLIGTTITLILLLVYFLYQKETKIGIFLLRKLDLMVMTWFLLLFPLFFKFYIEKVFHFQLKAHNRWILLLGLFFILFSLASLYIRKKAVLFPLYALRLTLLACILPIFCFLLIQNLSIAGPEAAGESGSINRITQEDLKDFNVLLITLDTCRRDKLSCYNFDRRTSPNIDDLAQKGFVFDNAYTASNWTKPATASLITSLYPGAHQTNTLVQKISPSIQCLPERFKQAGYHTLALSANANISSDFGFDQGVDYFYEIISKNMIDFSALYISLQKLHPYLKKKVREFKLERKNLEDKEEEEVMLGHFLRWLETIQDEKFFAYFHFNTPHSAYDPPPAFDIFTEDPTVEVKRIEPNRKEKLTEAQLERLLSLYYGEILHVDHIIGRMIKTLEQKGLMEKTIIAITADHGEEFYDHESWGHAHSMYNELLNIPLIFYVPDYPFPPGRVTNNVSIIDIGPTLMSLVGLPPDPGIDGKDLSPLLQGEKKELHDFIFAQRLTPKDDMNKYSVMQEGYKYIVYQFNDKTFEALFDMTGDFEEKQMLPLEGSAPYEKMKKSLAEMKQNMERRKIDSEKIKLSDEKKDQLKALGYID